MPSLQGSSLTQRLNLSTLCLLPRRRVLLPLESPEMPRWLWGHVGKSADTSGIVSPGSSDQPGALSPLPPPTMGANATRHTYHLLEFAGAGRPMPAAARPPAPLSSARPRLPWGGLSAAGATGRAVVSGQSSPQAPGCKASPWSPTELQRWRCQRGSSRLCK